MKTRLFILPAAAVALTFGVASMRPVYAEGATDIAAQELELKQKQLDLEKAKIEQQKAAEVSLEKAQLDVEQQKLELEKARQALAVKETADKLEMAVAGDVLFDTNQAVIKPTAKDTLSNVATVLEAYPNSKITVTGYTDSRGSDDINIKLSRDRAEAVKTWLLAQTGVSSDRVFTQGAGENDPAASNETAAGRQMNRRVDITVNKTF
jgi:outer membrane protein OmpA-like peptidoglycan-associated protein